MFDNFSNLFIASIGAWTFLEVMFPLMRFFFVKDSFSSPQKKEKKAISFKKFWHYPPALQNFLRCELLLKEICSDELSRDWRCSYWSIMENHGCRTVKLAIQRSVKIFFFFPLIKEANSRSKAYVGIIHVSCSFISLSDKSRHVASAAVYASNDTFPCVPDCRAPADHLHSRLYLLQTDKDEDTE